MIHRFPVLIFGLGVLAVGAPLFADDAHAPLVQAQTSEHVNFAPGGTIHLKHSFGNLSVEGWDQNEVEVTVVKSMGYDSEPASLATQHLDGVHIVTGHPSNTEMEISTNRAACPNRFTHPLDKCRDVVVEYRIRAPRNSRLVIAHGDGYVSVTGMTGNIEATGSRGDIVLMLPDLAKYSIEAHTRIGIVTSDIAGATRSKHLFGENFTRGDASLPRRLKLQMGFGGITIKELAPEVFAPATATPGN
jgi:hypothetical protein